jgi:hypothetical protein
MTKTLHRSSKTSGEGFTLGRKRFAKISAVEGIHLSSEMEAHFREFDRKGLSASERRKALAHAFGKAR